MTFNHNKLLGELLSGVFIIIWFLMSYLLSYETISGFTTPFTDFLQVASFLIFLPLVRED